MWPAAIATEGARRVLARAEPYLNQTAAHVRDPRVRDRQVAARDRGARPTSRRSRSPPACAAASSRSRSATAPGAEAEREALVAGLVERHERFVFSTDGSTIDEQVAALLLDGRRIGLGESCTAGLLAARLADPPGRLATTSPGGVVAYSNEAKVELLGVPAELIERHGAVSPEVAEAMADGALERFERRTSGSGSPGSPAPTAAPKEKPVGYVCVCVKDAGRPGDRARPGDPRRPRRDPRPLVHPRPAPDPAPAARRGLPALTVPRAGAVRDRGRRARSRRPARADRAHPVAEQPPGSAGSTGWTSPTCASSATHWAGAYDWRQLERALNGLSNWRWDGHPLHLGAGAGRRPRGRRRGPAAGAADPRLAGRRDRVLRPDPAAGRRRARRDRPLAARLRVLRRAAGAAQRRRGRRRACGRWWRRRSATSATRSRAATGARSSAPGWPSTTRTAVAACT